MARDYDAGALLGTEFEESPETLAFQLSSEFTTEVLLEAERQGVTLAELARRERIKQPTVCGMLRDDSNMTSKTIARMAMALGCEAHAPHLVPRSGKPSDEAAGNVEDERDPAALLSFEHIRGRRPERVACKA